MREIKFRAWDKEFKRWSSKALTYMISDINSLTDYEWMQYTGLKDENGREIYEGDIVRQLSEMTYDSITGVVKFVDGSYLIETSDGKSGNYLFGEVVYNEIFGNIHEDKHLLESST